MCKAQKVIKEALLSGTYPVNEDMAETQAEDVVAALRNTCPCGKENCSENDHLFWPRTESNV